MERNNEQVRNVWKPLCLVFAALLALSWVFFGFLYSKGGVDFSTLEKPEQNYVADGGGVIIGESTGNNARIMSVQIPAESYAEYGISPMAESAYQLTATITPDNADNKAVDWSVAFVNPASAWATGKTVTDYVTVTPTSDGALTANVECKQAFGEQIVVTVVSRDNAEATATCSVDYAAKVVSLQMDFQSATSLDGTNSYSAVVSDGGTYDVTKPFFAVGGSFTFSVAQLSDYTINDTFTIEYRYEMNAYADNWISGDSNWRFAETDFLSNGEVVSRGLLGITYDYEMPKYGTETYNNLLSHLLFGGVPYDIEVRCRGEYSTSTLTLKGVCLEEVFVQSVTSVSLDKSEIIY